MQAIIAEDGCPAFTASIQLQDGQNQVSFRWGVLLDGPGASNFWAITTETDTAYSADRYCRFHLHDLEQTETFHFTYLRRLGANKYYKTPGEAPLIRFAVWAPNASNVIVLFGRKGNGYIYDNGNGIDHTIPFVPLQPSREIPGVWENEPDTPFQQYFGIPYMYQIQNAQGSTVYRTDIFSRSQVGWGSIDPAKANWLGTPETLNGSVSCSEVIDSDIVRATFETPVDTAPSYLLTATFWNEEFNIHRPVPTRLEDLIIYELHIGALGFGKAGPGTLADAVAFLDYLSELGVNAIELLPMADFSGNIGWGYGDTHHMVIHSAAGGRDKYRYFIRECHRRGIAVIQDVVYNHYDQDAERAQWQYDSEYADQNIYYWYEGTPFHYTSPDGGYLDNGSTGYTPNFRQEIVRQQFISSAAFLLEEMHVDGLRVDLTQAIHRDNKLHADGREIGEANLFGQKFFREWSRTLKMIRPSVMLIAEDHTGWDAVTKAPADGGLGFDVAWNVNFYHSLIGDSDSSGGHARLLKLVGEGTNESLRMDEFAEKLFNSQYKQVVYHESHDEAGNAGGSSRTLQVAVAQAPLWGDTRVWAEMRSRVVFGLSILSAGTPCSSWARKSALKNRSYITTRWPVERIYQEKKRVMDRECLDTTRILFNLANSNSLSETEILIYYM